MKTRLHTYATTALWLAATLAACDPLTTTDGDVDAGNRDTAAGRHDDAVAAYDRAAKRYAPAPGSAPRERADADREAAALIAYNRGTALLAAGKPGEALEAFAKTLVSNDDGLRFDAHFNTGAALLKQLETTQPITFDEAKRVVDQAIDAYKRALTIRPGDRDARYNLEFALALRKQLEEAKKKQEEEQKKNPPPEQPPDENEGESEGEDASESESDESEGGDGDGPDDESAEGAGEAGGEGRPGGEAGEAAGAEDADGGEAAAAEGVPTADEGDGEGEGAAAAAAGDDDGEAGEGEEGAAAVVPLSGDEAKKLLDALRDSEQPFRLIPFQKGSDGRGAGEPEEDW